MVFRSKKASQNSSNQNEQSHEHPTDAEPGSQSKVENNAQSPLSILGMRQETWTDYESLDMEIQKGQAFALLGLVGVPVALLVLIGGIFTLGSEHIAMAVGIPALFVGGILAIGANIQRLQIKRLKRIRDNWDEEQAGS
ncbi:hypothetical protein LRD18_05800 [Halorhodospira halochloris]|uniref:Uncharacterized protein n=1 Tax=Halorhodospira halochloris TaxID=1052 RepID=A0A0X8XA08_HALHR|nr:hypothetical protein [Halorhodospira halochloris]MBK1652609.1 hypothetical protein [Halorhodospira halochloris]MCG5530387.1 hypothetical protein [Halorhodospira halochloris]BAU58201.1 hypothetical protein HH1059_14950 [Halorhodospira halochloris]